MTFEADLKAHLAAESSLVAAVGSRITPVLQEGIYPAVTYERVIGTPQTNLAGGDGGMVNVRVQIDVWSRSYDQARALSELIRSRMQATASTFRSVCLSDQDFYESESKVHRSSLDFSCWYHS